MNLSVSSPDGESGLRSYFRKAGLVPKPKPSSKKKPIDSSRLHLVMSKAGQR